MGGISLEGELTKSLVNDIIEKGTYSDFLNRNILKIKIYGTIGTNSEGEPVVKLDDYELLD